MIVWGVIASAMMLVRGVGSFYPLRALLGVVEAGFFPGVFLSLRCWFAAVERARAVAGFMTAIPISGVVGGPISGALLGLKGVAGLAGWQWLFLLEGLPSVLLGAAALWYLTDRPADAAWLPADERAWLSQHLQQEQARTAAMHGTRLRQALLSGVVWQLGLLYFLIIAGLYGQGLWLPQIIKGSSQLTDFAAGGIALINALGNVAGFAGPYLVGLVKDATGGYAGALLTFGVLMLAGAALALALRRASG